MRFTRRTYRKGNQTILRPGVRTVQRWDEHHQPLVPADAAHPGAPTPAGTGGEVMSEPMLWLALANGIIAGLMFTWGRSVGRKDNPWRKR